MSKNTVWLIEDDCLNAMGVFEQVTDQAPTVLVRLPSLG